MTCSKLAPFKPRTRVHLLVAGLALASSASCEATSSAPPQQPIAPPTPTTSAAAPEPMTLPSECDMPATSMRVRVDAGQTMPTGTGLSITHEGASHDNFGPAGFDIQVSLLFRKGAEELRHVPSFRDKRPHQALGHCYRLIDADLGVVLLEVAALPSPPSLSQDAPPTLEGVGGTLPPNAAPCTVVFENGPNGGASTSRGCQANEICVCEARAGYSCRGRCMPTAPADKKSRDISSE